MGDRPTDSDMILTYTCVIVAAYVSNNLVPTSALAALIQNVHETLRNLPERTKNSQKPAVSIHKSITPDYLICLEDGERLKLLKRYLRSRYGLTPETYRAKWNLPANYPMVAPNYAAKRSQLAKKHGLGRTPTVNVHASSPASPDYIV